MEAAAPGLRAIPSAAAATALACASPHRPEAIAMENPAAMEVHWAWAWAIALVSAGTACAKIMGLAIINSASIHITFFLVILLSLLNKSPPGGGQIGRASCRVRE